jgi:hypothetical protein
MQLSNETPFLIDIKWLNNTFVKKNTYSNIL